MVTKEEKEENTTSDNKKTLVELVEQTVKDKKYSQAVISGALSKNGLLQKYEKQYLQVEDGVNVAAEKTEKEFEKMITDFLNMKV